MSTDLAIAELQGREVPSDSGSSAEFTPAQIQLRRMVLDSVTSAHTRRNYAPFAVPGAKLRRKAAGT